MGDVPVPVPPLPDSDMTSRRRREPSEPRSDSDWDAGSSREGSPDLLRRAPAAQISRAASSSSPSSSWLREIERDRVRLVREWVHMAARDRDDDTGPPPSPVPDHARRDAPRIRGRQARLELVMRMAADRQAELHRLSQHRAVSDFPHRNRIHVGASSSFLNPLFHYSLITHRFAFRFVFLIRSESPHYRRRCSGVGFCATAVCPRRGGPHPWPQGSLASCGNGILSLV